MKIFLSIIVLLLSACANSGVKTIRTPLTDSYAQGDYIEKTTLNTTLNQFTNNWIAGNKNGFYHRIYKTSGFENRLSGFVAADDKTLGAVGKWYFECDIDKMTDKSWCNVYSSGHEAALLTKSIIYSVEKRNLCIGYHDFPYKPSSIRIDGQQPINISAQSSGCTKVSSSMLNNLENSQTIITRGYTWPYGGADDHTVNMAGFSEVLKVSQWVKQNDKLLKTAFMNMK